MAHELFKDSMAFVGETPWHGLGTNIPQGMASNDMIKAANLDWNVRKEPAQGARMIDPQREIYDRYVVLRDKVGEEQEDVALAMVGSGYEAVQNTDAFAFFEPLIEDKWASFHTAGALGNGERIWVLAKLNESIVIGAGDEIDRFLLLSNTHDGSSAVTVRFTPIRVVCQNTLSYAMEKGGKSIVSIRHTRHVRRNLDKARAEELKQLIDAVYGEAEMLFGHMAAREIKTEDVNRYLEIMFPRTEKQKKNDEQPMRWWRVKAILDDGEVTPPATRGTLWALYNAVVREEDFRATRETTPDARLERVWFGRGQDLKIKALNMARHQLGRAA